jgi:hypothetical protein
MPFCRATYTKSGTICRAFLDQHARKNADGEPRGELGPKPASPAQMSLAEKIALEKGIVIPVAIAPTISRSLAGLMSCDAVCDVARMTIGAAPWNGT